MKFGPYEILNLIGAGGMGEVYRARDARLQREVAVKVLPASFAADADRLRRFEQEARAAAALNHPNILSVFDIGTANGAPYIVSELLEGESLRERLKPGALPQRKAIEYAIQVARGLAAAHEKGIVHRDLKPENIYLTSDGRAKILDFGLAKLTETASELTNAPTMQSGTRAGIVLGTVGYMAPEQVRGKPADARSDIFAFGAVLYEMLAGARAFRGETAADVFSAILREEPPELAASNRPIAPALDRIVRHCLEKEPQQRFQSAGDIAFDLTEVSGASATSLAQPAVRASYWNRRRAILAMVGTVGVVLALAIGWMAGLRWAPAPTPRFTQLTFQQGTILSARFAPDGNTAVCAAKWGEGEFELYSVRLDSPSGMRPLGIKASELLSISSKGEMLLLLGPITGGYGAAATLARVPLGGGAPRPLLDSIGDADWSPDGESMAIARLVPERSTYQLEYPVGKVLYQNGGFISHVRVGRDGRRVAFLDHPIFGDDRGLVAMVDADGKKRDLTGLWGSIQGLAWSPSGDELWFTAARTGNNRSLYAVSLRGKIRQLAGVPGGMTVGDVNANGRTLVVHYALRRYLMVSAPGFEKERDLAWLDYPYAVDFSADGKLVSFSDQGEAAGPRYSVYLRNIDGSPALRLGDHTLAGLSPDGKWALAYDTQSPQQFWLLPTGAGDARQITRSKIDKVRGRWMADGQHILFLGFEPGHRLRTFLLDVNGTERPITPEGVTGIVSTPDGKLVLARSPERKWQLWPISGGDPLPVPGIESDETPVQFSADGRSLYAARVSALKLRVARIDVATGRRELFKEVGPVDPVGAGSLGQFAMTADARTYGYSYSRRLSTLFLIDGLKD